MNPEDAASTAESHVSRTHGPYGPHCWLPLPEPPPGPIRPLSSFADVRALADRVQPDIAIETETFGDFTCNPDGLFNRNCPYFEYTTAGGLHAEIHLAIESGEPTQICQIKVKFGDGWWGVDQNEISFDSSRPSEEQYPRYHLRWSISDKEPERIGQLSYAEYLTGPNKFLIFCYPHGVERKTVFQIAPAEIDIPESLTACPMINGVPVQMALDVKAKEKEILLASRLEAFMLSVPVR